MNTPVAPAPEASASPTLSERDSARLTITTRLIAAVMTGYMARGKDIDTALKSAESDRGLCLASASNLYDASELDFPADFSVQRLSVATDLFAAAVSGLVARGESTDSALKATARSREHILRNAQSTVRATIETGAAKPLPPTLEAFRASRGTPRGPGTSSAPGNPVL